MNIASPPQIVYPNLGGGSNASSDMIDIAGIVGVVWRRKYVVLLCVILSITAGFAVLNSIKPTYTAYASVLLDTRRHNVANITDVVSDLSVTSSAVAGEIAIMRSNILIGEVVDALDLVNNPQFDPRVAPKVGITDRVKGAINNVVAFVTTRLSGKPAEADGAAAQDDQEAGVMDDALARHLVIADIQNRLRVSQIGISYVIGIWFPASDPDTASRIANAIAQQYISDQIDTKRDAARRATDWLSERIERLKSQVEEAEDAVVRFKAEQARREGTVEATNQQLAGLNAELIRARAERLEADVRYKHVSELLSAGGFDAAAASVTSPLIETLSQQKAELERKEAELSKWFGPRHPEIVTVQAEVSDIDRSIDNEVDRIINGLRNEVDVQTAREEQVADSIEDAENRLVVLSETSVRLRQLERFADATRAVYENFLARYKETNEQTALQQADARVIGYAEPPASPSHPRGKLILAGSGILGISLGLALVFILELLSTVIRSPQALADVTDLPVLAVLPAVRPARGRRWLSKQLAASASGPYAEAVRGLRAVLNLPRKETGNVVMVTSALGDEGKSSTALALASVYHAIGLPTIIVECDLRRPIHGEYLGQSQSRFFRNCLTLVDYLEGHAELDDIVTTHAKTGLVYIPARRVSDISSADLLSSQRFERLMRTLTSRYAVVILDTPPTLALSDALVVTPYANRIVFAAMEGRSSREALQEGLEQIKRSGAEVTGTVLCRANVNAMSAGRRAALDYA